jgi:transposase
MITEEPYMESTDIEIRREKVFIPKGMCAREITKKYGISHSTAHASIKRG